MAAKPSNPYPLAYGHRIHTLSFPHAAIGAGLLGAFAGHVLVAVMNERGLFFRFALLPGNGREKRIGWDG
ncbi:hypothetical protein [Meiothermus sp.]|uniref:hypothetical protein n=1 Tax=Meiothermus sp. TaxID=1955249 RepID=UPI0021DC8F20|nr:hypothetical protein [Meiothermus sp.]GIW26021.1 MAG: hypothetical protein KatS3mg069_2288 [Meiothermus sp.]